MGRSIRKRHEELAARLERYENTLRRPRTASPTNDLATIAAKLANGFAHKIIRHPDDFSIKMKSKDTGKLTLALAKHMFARYPVPHHLEQVWTGATRVVSYPKGFDRREWWMTVAQGGSLHKEHTSGFFTRKETHAFLAVPVPMGFLEALWYAVARSYTDSHGLAFRISRCKLTQSDPSLITPFWKDAVRFFVSHNLALSEIDDLIDFFMHRRRENDAFALKGRTLGSLRSQMEEWHRDLARIRRVGGGRWDGLPFEGFAYEQKGPQPHLDVRWAVTQITTGDALAKEGNAMRHCVYSYKPRCLSGMCGIYSVTKRSQKGEERVLTVEVLSSGRIVQVRGFANRAATPEENNIVRRWALHAGLSF